MNKQTKIILSIIGIAAIAVPAILLTVLTKDADLEPNVDSSSRKIDTNSIQNIVSKSPLPRVGLPSPTPASPSASPDFGASPSAQ